MKIGLGVILTILGGMFFLSQKSQSLTNKYFSKEEFKGWHDKLAPDLEPKLNLFRELWGYPVHISSASGSVGRMLGKSSFSRHNIDQWGEVQAVDIFPDNLSFDEKQIKRAIACAISAGFGGVGIYTDTHINGQKKLMMHLDVRPIINGHVATWSRNNGQYANIDEALEVVKNVA